MSMWDAVAGLRFMETVPEYLKEISESLAVIAKNTENTKSVKNDTLEYPEIMRNPYMESVDEEMLGRAKELAEDIESGDDEITTPLINEIVNQITTDEENSDVQLINDYINASPESRAAMDCLMINLCGWSLGTMIVGFVSNKEEKN